MPDRPLFFQKWCDCGWNWKLGATQEEHLGSFPLSHGDGFDADFSFWVGSKNLMMESVK